MEKKALNLLEERENWNPQVCLHEFETGKAKLIHTTTSALMQFALMCELDKHPSDNSEIL